MSLALLPPGPALPFSMVRPEIVAVTAADTENTRTDPPPLTATPCPLMVTFLVIAIGPLERRMGEHEATDGAKGDSLSGRRSGYLGSQRAGAGIVAVRHRECGGACRLGREHDGGSRRRTPPPHRRFPVEAVHGSKLAIYSLMTLRGPFVHVARCTGRAA